MIVNAGLVRIVYDAPYPDAVAEQMLRDATVELVRLSGGSVPHAAPER
jgi:deoxycytidylate deaminase